MKQLSYLAAFVLFWCLDARAAFDIDFMRHGETTWNRAKVLQGSVDYTRLSAKGVAVAEASAEGLAAAGVRYDRVFTSPYRRTRETAAIVAAKTGPEPVVAELLHERGFGSAEGKRHEGGESLRRLVDSSAGVETEEEVVARVRAFLEELKPLDGKVNRVLCVAHAHVLNGLVAAFRGGRFDNSVLVPNNCIHTVHYEDGRFTLVSTGRVFYDPAFFDGVKSPRIVAHRGAGDLTMPEHSRAAYRDAVEKRCDIVKLDLQETKDGVIVLSHDRTLKRCMGWDVAIHDVTYAEIMEKGVYLEKGGVRGERIVRLDEALAIVKAVPEFWIDFKYFAPEFADRAVAEIRKAGIDLGRVMCATFTVKALLYLKEKHPEIRRIAHVGPKARLKDCLEMKDRYDLRGVNLPTKGIGSGLSPEDVAELKRRGLWVSRWFVQDAETAAECRASGCDAFVTDFVSRVRPEADFRP